MTPSQARYQAAPRPEAASLAIAGLSSYRGDPPARSVSGRGEHPSNDLLNPLRVPGPGDVGPFLDRSPIGTVITVLAVNKSTRRADV